MSEADIVLEARGLVRRYAVGQGFWRRGAASSVQAVGGVDLAVRRGETLAIVGESGCGKSTLARLLLRLEPPDSGEVWFDGIDIAGLDERAMRPLRRRLQVVFQDPFSSLNPRMTVGEIMEEPLLVHGLGDRRARRERLLELVDLVGLAAGHLDRHPHEFSGGQRQRIGIARALMAGPEVLIGDEPVSALDVSVQAQVINLLADLKARLGLTLILISHDLAVVRHMADRVGVMYLGRLVELAPAESLLTEPRHPYTRALLAAVPRPDPARRSARRLLEGDVPSPVDPPSGCRFHTRCPHVQPRCAVDTPPLDGDGAGHATACHFWRQLPAEPGITRAEGGHAALGRRLDLLEAARESTGPGPVQPMSRTDTREREIATP
jgi:oligopeptide transport system ATP-binding protein